MHTYMIDLHDRPGALERVLNLCRRKGFAVQTLQFGPGAGPGLRRVLVAFEDDCPPADRVLPNLTRIHDVVEVTRADAADVDKHAVNLRVRAA